jgi:hypothetical protein
MPSDPRNGASSVPTSIGGSCLCGDVAFALAGPVVEFVFDHCTRCRKATGSAFASELLVEAQAFRWLRGRDAVRVYEAPIVRAPPAYARWFCATCGGPVPREIGAVVLVPAGLVDGDPGARPMRHLFVQSKACWFDIVDTVPQFATKP